MKNVIKIVMGLAGICAIVVVVTLVAGGRKEGEAASATKSVIEFGANDVYKYPAYPGEEEWNKYDSTELKKMLKIPQEKLTGWTTEELVQVVLDYPYLSDVFYYDTLKLGYNHLTKVNESVMELLKREDAGECLARYYIDAQIPSGVINDGPALLRIRNFALIEVIIAFEQMNKTMPAELLQEFEACVEKNKQLGYSWLGKSYDKALEELK